MYANSRNFMIIVVNICWGVVGIVNFNIEDSKVLCTKNPVSHKLTGFLWVTDGTRTHDIQNHNLTL